MSQAILTGAELIASFERDDIAPDQFHHADHVHLAFAYLRAYPALDALARFSAALKRFAAACGKAQLYHETITFAYFFLIHERMAVCEGIEWDEFAERNADLLQWKDGILGLYYREETLRSNLARRVFCLPDKFLPDNLSADKSIPTPTSVVEVKNLQR